MQVEGLSITKSPNDNRQYEALTLSNGLKVLLINDKNTHKSACSISVGVGSLADPQSALGLAHFLEHMLFMGSSKFPSHDQYDKFISINSGYGNAFTQDDETNFYFDISNEAFAEALYRMCDFLISPVLDNSCIEKQIQAVHQEFVIASNDDQHRREDIIKKIARGSYANFNLGNKKTLQKVDIKQQLAKFYKQHYSANITTAVLYSNISIYAMKQQLVKYLEAIPNKKHPGFKYQVPFVSPNGKLIQVQSIFEQHVLQLFWCIPHVKQSQPHHIVEYICYQFNLICDHSLMDVLYSDNYAQKVESRAQDLRSQTLITLKITLTRHGKRHFERVCNIVLDYVANLRADKNIYEELKYKAQLDFKFAEKMQLEDYLTGLSSNMHKIHLEHILDYMAIYRQFDQQKINQTLSQLNSSNLIVVFATDDKIKQKQVSIDQYLRTRYNMKKSINRKKVKNDFKKIPPNKYFPLDTSLVGYKQKQLNVKKLMKNVYFMPDPKFNVCKGGIRLLIHGNEKYNFLKMYSDYFQQIFQETVSDAEALGVEVEFNTVDTLAIDIYGYSDIVKKLIVEIAQKLIPFQNKRKDLFQNCQQGYAQDLDNFDCDQLDQVAEDMLEILLKERIDLSPDDRAEQARKFKHKKFIERAMQFWKKVTLEWIFVGNFTEQWILKTVQLFANSVPKQQNAVPQPNRCVKLWQKQIKYQILLDDGDIKTSCCLVYYDLGKYSEGLFYILEMLQNYIEEPFYSELRTEKKLAYDLSINTCNNRGILGLYFVLISSTKDPEAVSGQIKLFLKSFVQKMQAQLTEQRFKQLKKCIKIKHLSQHINLNEMYQFVCFQIQNRTFYFSRKNEQELDKQLNNISRELFMKTVKKLFQKSLEILIVSKVHEKAYKSHQPKYYQFEDFKEAAQYHEDSVCTFDI